MTIWEICALARGEAELEQRGRAEPRAGVVRKRRGSASGFSIDELRLTIWGIRALARGEAELERRGKVEPRAGVVRKRSGIFEDEMR